jgi:hypothetical protein
MPRPCGCLGGNENCTFCHGSGYLPGGDSGGMSRERREWNAGSLRPGTRLRNPQPPKPKPHQEVSPVHRAVVSKAPSIRSGRSSQLGVGCPYCGERFTMGSALEKHVEANHVAEAHDHSEAGEAKPLVRADGRIWERRRLQKTKSSAASHPRAPIQQPAKNAIRQSPNHPTAARRSFSKVSGREGLLPCPKCPSLVRSDRIGKHLRNVHGLERNPTQGRSGPARARNLSKPVATGGPARYRALSIGSGVSGPAGDDNDERTRALDNYWEERRLDGSRDYWQVREEGRFGSHPSFDGCDDESAP